MAGKLTSLLLVSSLVVCAQTTRRLDTTNFIVVGEGLAAGMANYGLSQHVQEFSFPAQIARKFGTIFPMPLIQGPGLEAMFGLDLPVARIPTYPQTTVRVFPPNPDKKPGDVDGPTLFVFNLALPNWKLSDSLTQRPVFPIVQPHNPRQTTINLILGFPSMLFSTDVPLWTQYEYARAMNPSFAMIELGYYEALEAAAYSDSTRIPPTATFRDNYATIVRGLRSQFAEVMVTTVPDPSAAAYFATPATAARLLQTDVSVLTSRYQIRPGDLITRIGLYAIGNQFLSGTVGPLPPRSVLRAEVAAQITARVRELNTAISEIARDTGAVVYDLHAFFAAIASSGATAAGRRITGEYLGGFYSLDGVYPSIVGHGLIANDVLRFVNSTYGTSYSAVDLAPLAASDTALSYKVPE